MNNFNIFHAPTTTGDKLGNFEIQRLMSRYNQSEQLASSVLKKQDDTNNAIIGKVG